MYYKKNEAFGLVV